MSNEEHASVVHPVTELMSLWAQDHPDQLAVIVARRRRGQYRGFTYAAFEERTKALAAGFASLGLAGKRVAMMVTPGDGMFEAGYGLMRAGAIPVLIDPGLGMGSVTKAIAEARPEGFVGVPTALAARALYRWANDARVVVSAGRWRRSVPTLDGVAEMGRASNSEGSGFVDPDSPAAIVYTSGSTGAPKGVEMSHDVFRAQVQLITEMYGLVGGTVSLSTFAPFALLGPLMGLTTLLPRMDFSKPGDVDPTRIVELTDAFTPQLMFGSPALLDRIGRYGEATGDSLDGVELVLSAGAPVRRDVQRRVLDMVPVGTKIATPYGATEALPVSSIDSDQLASIDGVGICVGKPVSGVEVSLIPITDDALDSMAGLDSVSQGSFGEIVVRGRNVTKSYIERPEATSAAKLDWDGHVAHRMGDLGSFDADGRLWFGGRKSHRLRTAAGDFPTVPIESIVDAHPAVRRSAAVGLGTSGEQKIVVCIELEDAFTTSDDLLNEVVRFAHEHVSAHQYGADRVERVVVHGGFPVDIRHNSKIDRPALAAWVEGAR